MKNFIKWHLRWTLRPIIKDLKYFGDLSFYLLTRKSTNEKPSVKLYKEGLTPDHERPVCLFCSYDKENTVKENVYYYLNELKLAGFDIIFISTSDTILDADLEKLSSCCIRIMNRENRGYDFYGWKTALEKYPQYKLHTGLLLANDSVLGPLFDIRDIVARLESCDADIIGMTNCFQVYPHLQSYFLYCKKNVILSEEFANFFQNIDILRPKTTIIRKYEIGFSRILARKFRIVALYDLENLVKQVGYYSSEKPIKWMDPFSLWKPLITEFRFPFLKKSLFLSKKIEDVGEIPAVIARYTAYNPDTLTDWLPNHYHRAASATNINIPVPEDARFTKARHARPRQYWSTPNSD